MRRSRKRRHSLFSAILLELTTLVVIVAVAQPAWLTGFSQSIESFHLPTTTEGADSPTAADLEGDAAGWNAYAVMPHDILPQNPHSAAADRYFGSHAASAWR